MICPRCKTEVSSTDSICPTCKLKLIFKCPKCSSPIRIGAVSCKKCNYTFVKFCPRCHSANIATAEKCRKCAYDFTSNKKPQTSGLRSRLERLNQEHKTLETAFAGNSAVNTAEKPVVKKYKHASEKTKAVLDESNVAKNTKLDINNEKPVPNDVRPLLFYIDFYYIEKIFEKYDKV